MNLFQVDGVPVPLPEIEGLILLNLPSYAGGMNLWGTTKEEVRASKIDVVLPLCVLNGVYRFLSTKEIRCCLYE